MAAGSCLFYTGALYHGGVAVYDEYWGTVDDASNARAVAKAIGDANVGLLANHGVVVLGADIQQAYLRAMSFEWRSRQAWRIAAGGGCQIATRRAPTVSSSTPTSSPGCSRRWRVASCVVTRRC
jgi:ribulose-5-phosphate 4-epimerase/fuculose-1-phosphate aldolase